ncbi:hypothetical protein ACFVT1_16355 [Streptomyces sp. NPDC057963]|uniref:hypothetical protein n=1 Tax=Streptomyces sp. NPDC057963 TaxID=3346290 RepID=UPI0036E66AC5
MVRTVAGRQLNDTAFSLASVCRVWAVTRSGSPVGVVRNKAGVVTHPGGCRNAATVFTRSRPGADDTATGRADGAAAACAIAAPRAGASTA